MRVAGGGSLVLYQVTLVLYQITLVCPAGACPYAARPGIRNSGSSPDISLLTGTKKLTGTRTGRIIMGNPALMEYLGRKHRCHIPPRKPDPPRSQHTRRTMQRSRTTALNGTAPARSRTVPSTDRA